MVTVEYIESKKSEGQTSKQTYKQTNKQTREPLSKGDSHTGLIAFHIQLPLPTLASLTHFILHTSEKCNSNNSSGKDLAF